MNARAVTRWALWLVTLGLLCAVAAWRVHSAAPIQTNILALLPDHRADPALETAVERSRDAFSQRVLALVSGPDDAGTRKAALAARQSLLDAGLAAGSESAQVDKALALYRDHGFALLTPAQAERFDRQGATALATAVAVSLASPAGMVGLGSDPGGYVGRFVAHLPRPYPDFLPDGPLMSARRGDTRVFLLRMAVPEAAFGAEGSTRAAQAVAAAKQAVAGTCSSCRFEATGAALFSDAARHEARSESIWRSEEHTSELQSRGQLVCRLLLEDKNNVIS